MIAQDIGFPVLFSKERCSYSYSRLREKCWGINRPARARELYEISGLKGHPEVVGLAHKADFIAISVISRLEFFAFSALSQHDKQMFTEFVSRVEVLNLEMADTKLLDAIADIRIKRSLKLPDAIIMASAQSLDSVLVTADVKLAKAMESASYLFKPY